jgi:segregation and condensation protein B
MEEQNTQQPQENLARLIQSVLFYFGEPVSFKKLAKIFSVDAERVEKTIPELKEVTEKTGLGLIVHNDKVQLVTSPEASLVIEKIRKDEVTKDLSKAALETISIILYRDNVSRADIDFIRGVNSSFILRNLLVRGLVVRKPHPTDARTFVYTASHDLLGYLGVSNPKDLPDFDRVQTMLEEKIKGLESSSEENNKE